MATRYRSLDEFYPFYLSQHANRACRRLHFVGTSAGIALLALALATQTPWLVPIALIQGYALAWIGHFFFERNKPATFRYPWLSFRGDLRMWWHIATGKISL